MEENNLKVNKKILRVVFCGGGTGGHTFPLIAVARALKKLSQENNFKLDLRYFGPDLFSIEEFFKEGISSQKIHSGKFNRFFDLKNFLSPFKIFFGIIECLWHLFWFMPDVCLSKGGYGSIPVVFVCWLYRIPIICHESDSIPGLATKITSKFAKKIAISFQKTKEYFKEKEVILTGNPTRFEVSDLNQLSKETLKKQAQKEFGLREGKKLLVVIGGSQGAQALNSFLLDILPEILPDIEIIHQVGKNNLEEVKKEVEIMLEDFLEEEKKLYHLFGFLDEKKYYLALSGADLVLSRAGAGAIFDLAICRTPSILVPFPYAAGNHQKYNAYEYAKYGGAIIIEQENLLPHLVVSQIKELIFNNDKLKKMQEGAKKFATPEAAKKIAKEIYERS